MTVTTCPLPPSKKKQQQVWKDSCCTALAKNSYMIYLHAYRLAAMIYSQRYKTTTCLVSKSQCQPFWHVFFIPRSKVASCPSNNTDALQGLQVDLPFLGQRGWSRNRNEVAEWNPSFVEENVQVEFLGIGGNYAEFIGKLCFLFWSSLFFFQMQCEDVAQNESWAVHRLVCPYFNGTSTPVFPIIMHSSR